MGIQIGAEKEGTSLNPLYATPADYKLCRQLHKQYGTTYYFASRRFPHQTRAMVDALYGFVRTADEWVDSAGASNLEAELLLSSFRKEMQAGFEGTRPEHPVLRAFCDTVQQAGIPHLEPHLFLDAMALDLRKFRYATYAELCGYMRGSAAAVGLMMCAILGAECDDEIEQAACDLGNAMQLTNFLRDIREDYEDLGRIYIPMEDLKRFKVDEKHIAERLVDDNFKALMQFEIERARRLYDRSLPGIARLPKEARKPVALAHNLYSRILTKIEENQYDVFSSRARTSRWEKLSVALAPARI